MNRDSHGFPLAETQGRHGTVSKARSIVPRVRRVLGSDTTYRLDVADDRSGSVTLFVNGHLMLQAARTIATDQTGPHSHDEVDVSPRLSPRFPATIWGVDVTLSV